MGFRETAVNPDEAVALGAAVQAGVLEGTVGGGEVMDVWQATLLRALAEKQARPPPFFFAFRPPPRTPHTLCAKLVQRCSLTTGTVDPSLNEDLQASTSSTN